MVTITKKPARKKLTLVGRKSPIMAVKVKSKHKPKRCKAIATSNRLAAVKVWVDEYSVFRDLKPLKIGITKDMIEAKPDHISAISVRVFMRHHAKRCGYYKNIMADGAMRHDLNGAEIEPVTERAKELAAEGLQRAKADIKAAKHRRFKSKRSKSIDKDYDKNQTKRA